jgi:hypothetical protein
MTEKKRVYSAYRKAEQHMFMALKARKGEIKVRHSSTVDKGTCFSNLNVDEQ